MCVDADAIVIGAGAAGLAAARSLAGYGPEELIGTTPAELVHPADLPELNRLRSMSLTSKTPTTFTYRLRRKDGAYIWVETTWRPIQEPASETVVELVAVSRDITDRKHAESLMDDIGAKRS